MFHYFLAIWAPNVLKTLKYMLHMLSYMRKFDIFHHTFILEVLVFADPSVSEGALPARKHSPVFILSN